MEEPTEHLEARRPPLEETSEPSPVAPKRRTSRRWWAVGVIVTLIGTAGGIIWWKVQSPVLPVSVPLLGRGASDPSTPAKRGTTPKPEERSESTKSSPVFPAPRNLQTPPSLDLRKLATALAEEVAKRLPTTDASETRKRLDGIERHLATLTQTVERVATFDPVLSAQSDLKARVQRLSAKIDAVKTPPVTLPFSVSSTGRLGNVPFVVVDAGQPLQVSVGETFVGWTLESVEVDTGRWAFRQGAHLQTGSAER